MTARKAKASDCKKHSNLLPILFLLHAIEILLAIAFVFATPSEGDSSLFLGLSLTRWLLVTSLVILGLVFAIPYWLYSTKHKNWLGIEKRTLAVLQNDTNYRLLILSALVLAIIAFFLSLLSFTFTDEYVNALLSRILPLVVWLLLFSLQILVFSPWLRFGARIGQPDSPQPGTFRLALIALGVFGLIVIFIALTGLGLQPDRSGWENPGVPILATQIALAWLGALLLLGVMRWLVGRFGWKFTQVDTAVAIGLWLLAIWVWHSQPLTPTFFSPETQPPNFETYPYSDAATHDLAAQRLLTGYGFTDVVEKPAYSFFLAALHGFVGQQYDVVVFVQILLLALFPVVLFVLVSRLHHRLSGALLSLVIIFREANTIALSGEINVSHSKLLMTDLPAALGMAVFTYVLLRWLQADKRNLRWPLWVGASLGLLLLLRSQIIIFLPVLLILALWHGGKNMLARTTYASLLLIGFLLAALPWMWRNYQRTDQFGYSQPLQMLYLAKQYSLNPEEAYPGFPEDTPVSEYASRGLAKVIQFTLSHPGEVATFITTHFLHNEVSSLLVLPTRFDLAERMNTFYNLRPFWLGQEIKLWSVCCSLNATINDAPYWHAWDGTFPSDAWLMLIVNLGIVSIGVLVAWKKVGWLVLVPISVHLFYNLSTSIARVSGWRLILPVDWVLILFYCIGLGQLTLWAWGYLFNTQLSAAEIQARAIIRIPAWRKQGLPAVGAAILLAGLFLPIAEITFPAHYAGKDLTAAQAEMRSSQLAGLADLDLPAFLTQPGARVLWGRGLYPRFYAAGRGEPGDDGTAFNIQPLSRLAFWIVGEETHQAALSQETVPFFPNAVDVLVLGCEGDSFFRAAAVVFTNGEAPTLLSSAVAPFDCSP